MSSTQLVTATVAASWTTEQIDLIKRMIAKNATDDELKLFLYHAKKCGLDPLAKQVYFQRRQNKKTGEWQMTIITSIDGYRLVASRTGEHAGTDDAVFDSEGKPTKATVTVYRMIGGIRCPFTATARWIEYCPQPGQDYMWQKMKCTMLGKCAEGLALRKAFPQELGGMYTKEEMDQAEPPQDSPAASSPNDDGQGRTAPVATSVNSEPLKTTPGPTKLPWTATPKQLERLWAITRASGWSGEEAQAYMKTTFNVEHSKGLTREQYDALCEHLKANPVHDAQEPSEWHGEVGV